MLKCCRQRCHSNENMAMQAGNLHFDISKLIDLHASQYYDFNYDAILGGCVNAPSSKKKTMQ